MPRIIGIDIPNKRMEIALTYVYGIGRTLANRVLEDAGVSPDKRANDLDDQEITAITQIIQEKYQVEGDLRRLQTSNIKRLMSIGTYRGIRHKRNLPVRGQRTKTNARTCKGPKRTVGAFKDKTAKKAPSTD
ncbi:MAG: 30S ribosomal protein S13 [Candidatus Omnitrophica bacterium]|nr:30S ribosomal protein S13 [Candidatus Omnitrophota bacterium]MBU1128454.1 30S ribosomal protein S13 [Candidatus Omnitrophota bacterium]MBU1656603.1 30S ribosomal protein S13 [Candidatus Omnitrophota bacterium]MBU1784444.1 30S ribosomal protein S13 [Candidatus Omnitrophota bacterium]MBU1851647.1 30S ribosomal protein S13 [Candidatus Omnitrophota bacterium]